MRLDTHQHFWRYDPAQHVWMTAAMGVLRRDYLPADLEPLLGAAGVDGTNYSRARIRASLDERAVRIGVEVPTTLFSSASPESVARSVEWHEEPFDPALVAGVQAILAPVQDKQWSY